MVRYYVTEGMSETNKKKQ